MNAANRKKRSPPRSARTSNAGAGSVGSRPDVCRLVPLDAAGFLAALRATRQPVAPGYFDQICVKPEFASGADLMKAHANKIKRARREGGQDGEAP